jgi:hypothetical protein
LDLAIREVLTGDPKPGHRVKITLCSGKRLIFGFRRHEQHDAYIWMLIGKYPKKLLRALEEAGRSYEVSPEWFTVYISDGFLIADGEQLYVNLIPNDVIVGAPLTQNERAIKMGRVEGMAITRRKP